MDTAGAGSSEVAGITLLAMLLQTRISQTAKFTSHVCFGLNPAQVSPKPQKPSKNWLLMCLVALSLCVGSKPVAEVL